MNRKIKTNLVYQMGYQLLLLILPLITTPYISRVIGPEKIGEYSYASSIVSIFTLIANLGISSYGNRTIASVCDDKSKLTKAFWEIYWAHVVCSVGVCIIYYYFVTNMIVIDTKMALLQSLQLWGVVFDITWFFTGIQNFKLTVLRNVAIRIISLISIYIFVKEQSDIYIYVFILLFGNVVGQIVVWPQLRRHVGIAKVEIKKILKHYKPMLLLFIPVMAMSVYKYMDKVMIRQLSSFEQLGYYECSEKIMTIPIGVITAMGYVMLPTITRIIANGKVEQGKQLISKSIRFSMFLSVGLVFGLIGIAPVFTPVFFGEEYRACVELISCIAVTVFFMAWANDIRSQYLIPYGKEKGFIVAVFMGAAVNIAVNKLLIGRCGALGAVIGTICAEGTVAVVQTFFAYKDLDIKGYIQKSIFYVLPGAIMCVCVRYIGSSLGESVATVVLQVLLGGVIFLGLSFCYMYLKKDDLFEVIFDTVRKRK